MSSASPSAADLCPLCRADSLLVMFARPAVPTMLNRFYSTTHGAQHATVGRLEIVACQNCGFVFNSAFDPSRVTYDAAYENDQGNSPAFARHISAMANRILDSANHCTRIGVIEIGCGQGRFLYELVKRGGSRINPALGYDPAWHGTQAPAGVRIEARTFDPEILRSETTPINVVVARHVIEHVPDPVKFLSGIRSARPQLWNGRLFLETPSLEWILQVHAMHDFLYEHCNYFTTATLRRALVQAGFCPSTLDLVFEGQYFWLEAEADEPRFEPGAAGDILANMPMMRDRERTFVEIWRTGLARFKLNGGIAVWGAGAKGVTFVNAVDPYSELVTCLIDINPAKQNRFTPITAHPVYSPEQAISCGVTTIVVMNPIYLTEVDRRLAELQSPTPLSVVSSDYHLRPPTVTLAETHFL